MKAHSHDSLVTAAAGGETIDVDDWRPVAHLAYHTNAILFWLKDLRVIIYPHHGQKVANCLTL
jgi:hypothetical protein